MKLAVRIFATLLLAAAVAMVFLYKGGKPEADNTPPPVRPVKSMLVGPPPRVPAVHFPGTVDARAGVDLSFEVGGRIVEFPATRGQEVKEGDVLARLDDRDYANNVKTAEAELAYYESNFKRMEAALAQNAVSQNEFSSARASRDKARASLDSAKKALDDTVLKARFSGVVSDVYVEQGVKLTAMQPLLRIVDLRSVKVSFTVGEKDLSRFPRGGRVGVEVPAAGREFRAVVESVATEASPLSRTYECLARPLSSVAGLTPGMVCKVGLSVSDAGIVIPASAVRTGEDGRYVWIVRDGVVQKRIIGVEGYSGSGIAVYLGNGWTILSNMMVLLQYHRQRWPHSGTG